MVKGCLFKSFCSFVRTLFIPDEPSPCKRLSQADADAQHFQTVSVVQFQIVLPLEVSVHLSTMDIFDAVETGDCEAILSHIAQAKDFKEVRLGSC